MRDGRWRRFRESTARRGRSTLNRVLTLALLAILTAGLATLTGPVQPASAQVAGDAEVRLSRVTPSVAHPDSTVVIEGTVRNTSDRPLVRLQVAIWRDLAAPVTTRSGLETINASEPSYPVGERMYLPETPRAYQDLYTEQQPNLAPGESKQFRLQAEASDFFGGSPQDGVYVMGVQVRENATDTVGRARTYLPAQTTPGDTSELPAGQNGIDSSTIVKLASTPSMVRPDVFADDDLADEIAPGGRLDTLLTAAEESGVSFAVDPSLIAEIRSMRDGYDVLRSDGSRVEGSGADDAQTWMERFETELAGPDGFRLPYGDVELATLLRAGRLDIAETGETAAERVGGVADLPLLVAPSSGAAGGELLAAADDLGADAVLLADTAVDGLGPVVQAAADGPKILSYDTESAASGPGPDPRDTPVQQRQMSLADSYVDALSGEDPATLARLTYVTEPAAAGRASAEAPWMSRRSVGDLLAAEAQQLTGGLHRPDEAADAELTDEQVDRVLGLEQNLTLYRELLAESKGTEALIQQAVPRAMSSSWHQHPKAMIGFVNDQQRLLTTTDGRLLPLEALTDGGVIRVESNPQVTLTGSSGAIPVTVVNNLDAAVRIKLVAESQNRSRLELDQLPADTLGSVDAGARVPAQIAAHARANGPVQINVQLATTSGEPIGEPLPIRVNATQAGRIGWVIASASGVVLLLTVVLRIRQVARERSAEDADTDASEPDDSDDEPVTARHAGQPSDGDPVGASGGRPAHAADDPNEAAPSTPGPASDGAPRG